MPTLRDREKISLSDRGVYKIINGKMEVSLDEAMTIAKYGKFQYFLITISGLFIASVFCETMGPFYVLPVAECDLNIDSKFEYGMVGGVWFTGIVLTSHAWGIFGDLYGRRKALIYASLLAFIASALSSFAVNKWQLMFLRFLNGFFISGSSSIIFVYLGEFIDSKNRSKAIMMASVVYTIACMALPFFAWVIINQKWSFEVPLVGFVYKPWRLFLLCCGMMSLICGVVTIFFPESPSFTFAQGNDQETLKIINKIHTINTSEEFPIKRLQPNLDSNQIDSTENFLKAMINQTFDLFKNYPRSIILISIIQFGLYYIGNGMMIFLPNILNQVGTYQLNDSSTICDVMEHSIVVKSAQSEKICELDLSSFFFPFILDILFLIGYLVISWVVNYTGRLPIFTFVYVITSISGFAINFTSASIGRYFYLSLLCASIGNTTLNIVTYDAFPTNLRSLAMSLSLMIGRLGALVGGNLGGFLIDNYCATSFTLAGAIVAFIGILTFFIPHVNKKK